MSEATPPLAAYPLDPVLDSIRNPVEVGVDYPLEALGRRIASACKGERRTLCHELTELVDERLLLVDVVQETARRGVPGREAKLVAKGVENGVGARTPTGLAA